MLWALAAMLLEAVVLRAVPITLQQLGWAALAPLYALLRLDEGSRTEARAEGRHEWGPTSHEGTFH